MPQECSICAHKQLEAINVALIQGSTMRDVAARYGVSCSAVHRHKQAHLTQYLAKAERALEIVQAGNVLEEVENLAMKAKGILDQAEQAGNLALALKGIRECRSVLELLARLKGELDRPREEEQPAMLVFSSPMPSLHVHPTESRQTAKDCIDTEAEEVEAPETAK